MKAVNVPAAIVETGMRGAAEGADRLRGVVCAAAPTDRMIYVTMVGSFDNGFGLPG